jgi:diguanylate cyclase (GGDEF)-like protein
MSNLREREHSRVIASYDAITGLPNRRVLRERLGQALLSEAPRGAQVALCVVSLLALPRIQRALGHVVGDAALRQTAYRLLRALPGSDAFRLSDGELAVVFSGPLERDALYRLGAEIVRALGAPIDLAGATGLRLDPCAGVAVFPDDGHSADLLIRNAAEASREAHEARGAPVRFYSVEGGAASRSAIEIESSLGAALERGEIQVAYQPIVDANSLELTGAEALMRWMRPDGPVSPGEFIPVAERTGLIRELGEFVMDEACGFLGAGIARGLPPIQLHVNVSPHQLRDDGLFHTVQSALLGGGLAPSDLVLELTETMETDGDDETASLLDRVRALGVRLAVDDFGTGYASFDYLRRFSISTLKIDMCFVKRLPENATDAAIVRAILALADGFQLKVVAEGVENEAQLAFLREAGCHENQGFLFAEPLAPDAFVKRWEEAADRGEIG